MKKMLFFLLFFSLQLFSQTNCVQLTNSKSGKIYEIEDDKRVKIKTKEGEKYFGRFKIVDSTSIQISGKTIPLEDIVVFKNRSTTMLFLSAGLITIGALTVGIGSAI